MPPSLPGLLLSSMAAAAATVLLSAGLVAGAGPQPRRQSDGDLVAEGKALYVENCQPCHGAEGKGDGPAARFLDSRPRDLTRGEWVIIEDGSLEEIVGVVSEGVPGTDMEPFTDLLEEQEIRAIAAYVVAEIAPPIEDEAQR